MQTLPANEPQNKIHTKPIINKTPLVHIRTYAATFSNIKKNEDQVQPYPHNRSLNSNKISQEILPD
jgi:hypothetical protein